MGILFQAMSLMRSVVIVGGTVAVGLGLIVFWALMSQPPPAERGPLTYIEASSAASGFVELGEVGIAVAENFIGNRIFFVRGSVRNISQQPLRSIELGIAFQDYAGTPVHEFVGEGLRSPLQPDETGSYEFSFEDLPAEWNYAAPQVEVLRVGH